MQDNHTTMPSVRQVVYVRQARSDLQAIDLVNILREAQRLNDIHHISGILLHNRGQFMQAIEGSPGDIEQLLINLRTDHRQH